MNSAIEKLEELKEVEAEIKAYELECKLKIAQAIPEDIAKRVEWLEKQLIDFLAPISLLRDQLEKEIKADVLAGGSSAKADNGYQAVYVKGRITWDGKALNGYAAAHPEIKEFKKTGKPSVSIRKK